MMDDHPTGTPTKNADKRVVFHVSCDSTQRRTFEAACRVGGLNRH